MKKDPEPIFTESIVAGIKMERSLEMFVQACEVHIQEEQAKILPDNSLISVLCDAVRLAREYCSFKIINAENVENARKERGLIVGAMYRQAAAYRENGFEDRAETLEWHAGSFANCDHRRINNNSKVSSSLLPDILSAEIIEVSEKLKEYFGNDIVLGLEADLSTIPACTCGNWGYCGYCVQNVGHTAKELDKLWEELRQKYTTTVLFVNFYLPPLTPTEETTTILDQFDNEFWLEYKNKMKSKLEVELRFMSESERIIVMANEEGKFPGTTGSLIARSKNKGIL